MGKTKAFSITIADCDVEVFRAGGPGGQKVNKTSSACRITHRPSGAVGESREERSQWANKQRAFRRMAESERFTAWLRVECARRDGTLREIEAKVEREMHSSNLRVEVHDERGRWTLGNTSDG